MDAEYDVTNRYNGERTWHPMIPQLGFSPRLETTVGLNTAKISVYTKPLSF